MTPFVFVNQLDQLNPPQLRIALHQDHAVSADRHHCVQRFLSMTDAAENHEDLARRVSPLLLQAHRDFAVDQANDEDLTS